MSEKKKSIALFLGKDNLVYSYSDTNSKGVESTGKNAFDYCVYVGKEKLHKQYDRFLLWGKPSQSALIFNLKFLKMRGFINSILLCGMTKDGTLSNKKPNESVVKLFENKLATGLGGFHEINSSDIFCLSLQDSLVRNKENKDKILQEYVETHLPAHPLYRHLLFNTDFDLKQICLLMAKIIDPRYFNIGNWSKCGHMVRAARLGDGNLLGVASISRAVAEAITEQQSFEKLVDLVLMSYILQGWTSVISVTHRNRFFVPELFFEEYTKTPSDEEPLAQAYKKFISTETVS